MIMDEFLRAVARRTAATIRPYSLNLDDLSVHISKETAPSGAILVVNWSFLPAHIENEVSCYSCFRKELGYREHQHDLVEQISDDICETILSAMSLSQNFLVLSGDEPVVSIPDRSSELLDAEHDARRNEESVR